MREDSPITLAVDRLEGWQFISLSLKLQTDASACGVWLTVARDCWLRYVGEGLDGTHSFGTVMLADLKKQGVADLNLPSLQGRAKTAARLANQDYILGQRADMRALLVQAAARAGVWVLRAPPPSRPNQIWRHVQNLNGFENCALSLSLCSAPHTHTKQI